MSVFVAWIPDGEARRAIAIFQNEARRAMSDGAPRLRWQPADRLHMTVRYLGDRTQLASSALGDLPDALARTCRDMAPCAARLDRIDAWRRVLVARAAPSQGLLGLFAGIEAAARACGFAADEREAAPHVTLAHGTCSAGIEARAAVDLAISTVCLMESDGRGYRMLASWALSGPGQTAA